MTELSETFWLTLMATGSAIVALIIKKLSSSKYDEVSCFGIRIHRKVELEEEDLESKSDSVRPPAI